MRSPLKDRSGPCSILFLFIFKLELSFNKCWNLDQCGFVCACAVLGPAVSAAEIWRRVARQWRICRQRGKMATSVGLHGSPALRLTEGLVSFLKEQRPEYLPEVLVNYREHGLQIQVSARSAKAHGSLMFLLIKGTRSWMLTWSRQHIIVCICVFHVSVYLLRERMMWQVWWVSAMPSYPQARPGETFTLKCWCFYFEKAQR